MYIYIYIYIYTMYDILPYDTYNIYIHNTPINA